MKAIFALAFVALIAVAHSDKICEEEHGNSKCALSCFTESRFYSGGSCNEEKQCVCKDTRNLFNYDVPEKLGPCPKDEADLNCKLGCFFYQKYKDGFCDTKTNTCYCVHKWASTK